MKESIKYLVIIGIFLCTYCLYNMNSLATSNDSFLTSIDIHNVDEYKEFAMNCKANKGYEGKVIIPQQDSEYMGQAWVGAYVKGVNKMGDLDNNGVVDANDASLVLERYKSENATRREIQIADIDRNGLLDANDASLILEIYKTNA